MSGKAQPNHIPGESDEPIPAWAEEYRGIVKRLHLGILKADCPANKKAYTLKWITHWLSIGFTRSEPAEQFHTIVAIKTCLRHGLVKEIHELGLGKKTPDGLYQTHEEKNFLQFSEIATSISLARRLLLLYQLGFIEAPGGDLRKAKPIAEAEWMLAGLRLRCYRDRIANLDLWQSILAERRADPKFLRRYCETLRAKGLEFQDVGTTKVQRILFCFWSTPITIKNGTVVPPLAYFSCQALHDLFRLRFGQKNLTLDALNRIIGKLDLQRAKPAYITSVESKPGSKLVVMRQG